VVRHIVLWRLKESANGRGKAENAAQIKRRLEELNGKISGMIELEVGFDFSRTADSSDIVLYSEFESRAALDAYQVHPLHEAVKPIVMAACEERRLVDYASAEQG
jgi:quinol monooxygenase YgiN